MRATALVVPGDLQARTGGYGYDRRIVEGLRARGWRVDVHALDASFPQPTDEARTHAAVVFAQLPDGLPVIVDGLAYGALPAAARTAGRRLRLVALVHHPLAAETGLDEATAAALEASERSALAHARVVIVTSPATAAALGPYGVTPDRIAVAVPGTDPAPLARGRATAHAGPVALLSVASFTPRKGHDILAGALARLGHLDWHLTCLGSLDRDPATADRFRRTLDDAGLLGRVAFAGEVAGRALDDAYDAADVFVLPTRHEGYGMAVAEALARGLPVIATPTGGIPDLVGEAAGVLVPIGDVDALAGALKGVVGDAAQRARLADGARRVRATLPTWDDTVAAIEHALARAVADGVQR